VAFTPMTLAEDADLDIAIGKAGYNVVYDEEAVALTEAPDTVRGLVRQRFRWMFGTAQRLWKHRDCLLNPKVRSARPCRAPQHCSLSNPFSADFADPDVTLAFSVFAALLRAWQNPKPRSDPVADGGLAVTISFSQPSISARRHCLPHGTRGGQAAARLACPAASRVPAS